MKDLAAKLQSIAAKGVKVSFQPFIHQEKPEENKVQYIFSNIEGLHEPFKVSFLENDVFDIDGCVSKIESEIKNQCFISKTILTTI